MTFEQLIDAYGHNYRDMNLNELDLKKMLREFAKEIREISCENISPSLNHAVNKHYEHARKVVDTVLFGFPKKEVDKEL